MYMGQKKSIGQLIACGHTSNQKDRRRYLIKGLALMLGCFFYVTGNFGFLNIFGIRREVQALFILLLIPILPILVLRARRWLHEPILWMTIATLLAEIFIRQGQSVFFLYDRIATVFVVATLFSFSYQFSNRVLKTVILVASVFSIMVVIQAIIIWFKPDLLSLFPTETKFALYTTSTQAAKVELNHPIEYLGFMTPGILNVAGHEFARFRSFVSEPSAIICTFLAPGVLALGFKGAVRLAAVPILLFAGLLSGSGTAFLSIALGALAYLLLYSFRQHILLLSILPLILILLLYGFIATTDVSSFMISVNTMLEPLESEYGALNKIASGTARLSIMAQHLRNFNQYLLFGAPFVGAGGLLLHMFLYIGIVGLVLVVVVSHKILKLTVSAFAANRGMERLMAGLLYGLFFQVLSFSEFGWMSMSGFMMLVLMTRRLKNMLNEQAASQLVSTPC